MATFGSSLVLDQFKGIDRYLSDGIAFNLDVRDFLKERAELEKEFGRGLESLTKRYSAKLKQRILDDSNNELDFDSQQSIQQPVHVQWQKLLEETEKTASLHLNFSADITSKITEPLKTMLLKKENARKKHVAFQNTLADNLEASFNEKKRLEKIYEDKCNTSLAAKQRFEKAEVEKIAEKLKKAWEGDVREDRCAKNNALIAIELANLTADKYYNQDIPFLYNSMQATAEDQIAFLKDFLGIFCSLNGKMLVEAKESVERQTTAIEAIQPTADSLHFIDKNKKDRVVPAKFTFSPVAYPEENNNYYTDDDDAATRLLNTYHRADLGEAECNADINKATNDISGLSSLYASYSKNPALGDSDEVNESIVQFKRDVNLLQTQTFKLIKTKEAITAALGQSKISDSIFHNFIGQSFPMSPATCDVCKGNVWGLAKNTGLVCPDCNFVCHPKCELKAKPSCGKFETTNKKSQLRNSSIATAELMKKNGDISSKAVDHKLIHTQLFSVPDTPDSIPSPISAASNTKTTKQIMSPKQSSRLTIEFDMSLSNLKSVPVLYDYTAQNEDELSISAGESVQILENDGSGWIKVANETGDIGIVPENYIRLLGSAAEGLDQEILDKSILVEAIYDYEGGSLSDLSFKAGDVISVVAKNGNGWWVGMTSAGRKGQFPGNYVKEQTTQ